LQGQHALCTGTRRKTHREGVKGFAQAFSQGFEVSLLARPKARKCARLIRIGHAEIFLTLGGGKELSNDQTVSGVGPNPLDIDPYRPIGRDRQQSNRIAMGEIELDRCGGTARLHARLSPRPVVKSNERRVHVRISTQYLA
jgi:hypothetical protein